jgi:hypothetical protein
MAANDGIVYNELESYGWKRSWPSLKMDGLRRSNENRQPGQSVSGPRLEAVTSRIRSKGAIRSAPTIHTQCKSIDTQCKST